MTGVSPSSSVHAVRTLLDHRAVTRKSGDHRPSQERQRSITRRSITIYAVLHKAGILRISLHASSVGRSGTCAWKIAMHCLPAGAPLAYIRMHPLNILNIVIHSEVDKTILLSMP